MKCDPSLDEPRELWDDVGCLGVAKQPAADRRVRGVHRHVQRRETVFDDSRRVPRLEVGEGGEVAVAKRQPIIVVADIQRRPQAIRVAVDEAEIAVVPAAPDARRFERHAHREPLGTLNVVLDLPPRG